MKIKFKFLSLLVVFIFLIVSVPMGISDRLDSSLDDSETENETKEIEFRDSKDIQRDIEQLDRRIEVEQYNTFQNIQRSQEEYQLQRQAVEFDRESVDTIRRAVEIDRVNITDQETKEEIEVLNLKIATRIPELKDEFKYKHRIQLYDTSNYIDERDIIIEKDRISINSQNYEFVRSRDDRGIAQIRFYVGTDGMNYNVYHHPDFDARVRNLQTETELLKENVTSNNGYVVFEVEKFSTIFLDPIDKGDGISYNFDDYFDMSNKDSASMSVYDVGKEISYMLLSLNKFSGSIDYPVDSLYTDCNVEFKIFSLNDQIWWEVDNSDPEDDCWYTQVGDDYYNEYLLTLRAYDDENLGGSYDEQLINVETEAEGPPPEPTEEAELISSISDLSISGTDYDWLSMSDYFDNYNEIRLNIDGSWTTWYSFDAGFQEIYNNDFIVEIDAYDSPTDEIYLDFIGKNINVDEDITIKHDTIQKMMVFLIRSILK